MTDLEFQLLNERSELRYTINSLRAELKQREDAYNELSAMFESCQRKLSEALQREEIATKIINEKRKEIERLKND
jgi:chromosome segregation ATPase